MKENKSSLNPQVQQLQVPQPLAQLSFRPIGFPSSWVLSPSSCPSLGPAGGTASLCLALKSSIQDIVNYAKESLLPTFSSLEGPEYQPLTALGSLEGVGCPVSPWAQWEASKISESHTLRINAFKKTKIHHLSYPWTSLTLCFSFITHFNIYLIISVTCKTLCCWAPWLKCSTCSDYSSIDWPLLQFLSAHFPVPPEFDAIALLSTRAQLYSHLITCFCSFTLTNCKTLGLKKKKKEYIQSPI